MLDTLEHWKAELVKTSKKEKVAVLSSFFKTGKGEYGEGDVFIGVTVPDNRRIAKMAVSLPFSYYKEMLASEIHEFRLSALLALVERYKKSDAEGKSEICTFYISNTKGINNWDLVDLSAPYIIGEEAMRTGSLEIIRNLSDSSDMWERRISVVANLSMVRKGIINPALEIVEKLLYSSESLMQKANGWLLREVGKKEERALIAFLDKYSATMPRTTLRYSLERLPDNLRAYYMTKKSRSTNIL